MLIFEKRAGLRVLAAIVGSGAIVFASGAALGVLFALSVAVMGLLTAIVFQFDFVYRKINQTANFQFRQLESVVALHSTIQPQRMLPTWTQWAITPDMARLLVSQLQARRPRLVVDLGSGVSTLLAAYVLREYGGKVIGIDHDARFAEKSRQMIEMHGLGDVAEVRHAPLASLSIDGRDDWRWYDVGVFSDLADIDFLFVDGPPGDSHPLARYPAVSVLRDQMADEFAVLLDDAKRTAERKIVELLAERHSLHAEWFEDIARGGVLLTSKPASVTT